MERESIFSTKPETYQLILFACYKFFSSLAFQRGVFVVYLSTLSFSMQQIGLLQACLFLSKVALEIPAGWFADRFGRRLSVSIGLVASAVAAIGNVTLANDFLNFVLLFLIAGGAIAFISGADFAILYTVLSRSSRAAEYAKISGRTRAVGAVGFAVAVLIGGALSEYSWTAVYLCYAGAMAASVACMLALPIEQQRPAGAEERVSLWRQAADFLRTRQGSTILVLILVFGLFEASTAPYYIFAQKILETQGVTRFEIGAIYAATELLVAAAYALVHKIAHVGPIGRHLPLLFAVTTFALLANALNSTWIFVASFLLLAVLPEAAFVLFDSLIQANIPSRARAMLLSFVTFVHALMIAGAYIIFGRLLDKMPYTTAVCLLAALPLIGLMLALLMPSRKLVIPTAQTNGSKPT